MLYPPTQLFYIHVIRHVAFACFFVDPCFQDEESTKKGEGVRQGRFVLMTDRLFDMADRAPHDHCPSPALGILASLTC